MLNKQKEPFLVRLQVNPEFLDEAIQNRTFMV